MAGEDLVRACANRVAKALLRRGALTRIEIIAEIRAELVDRGIPHPHGQARRKVDHVSRLTQRHGAKPGPGGSIHL